MRQNVSFAWQDRVTVLPSLWQPRNTIRCAELAQNSFHALSG